MVCPLTSDSPFTRPKDIRSAAYQRSTKFWFQKLTILSIGPLRDSTFARRLNFYRFSGKLFCVPFVYASLLLHKA